MAKGNSKKTYCVWQIKTPLGKMLAVASQRGLCGLEFDADDQLEAVTEKVSRKYPTRHWDRGDGGTREVREARGLNAHIEATKVWIKRYFSGDFDQLKPIPLDFTGTEFEKKIWMTLFEIPVGKLATYGELAESAGFRGAARAVGSAVGRNPVSIIVPCHRIIGKNHALTGYGGGLDRKQWLLKHEGFEVTGKTRASLVAHSDSMAFAGLR